MLKKILYLVLSSVSLLAMHSVELNINDLDLEGAVKLDVGQYTNSVEPDTTFVGISYINANENYSYDEDGNSLNELGGYLDLNFLIKEEIKNSDFSVGLGVKTVFISIDNPNLEMFSAIPLGIEVEYALPLKKVIPIWFGAEIYYAPESLSFADSRSYFEYRIEANFEVIKRGTLYFGFRNIDTNYIIDDIKYDYTYNQSGYFGFKFSF